MALPSKLASLRPSKLHRLIDLLDEVGVDVSHWHGNPTHPSHCYSWSFVDGATTVFNLWHDELLQDDSGRIYRIMNLREKALEKERKGQREKRANAMDSALQQAFRESRKVHVFLLEGDKHPPGGGDAIVKLRVQDPELWQVVDYDWASGACVIERLDAAHVPGTLPASLKAAAAYL